jgi:hypothetical protein
MPGARHTTWRVIFDPTISAEDAVSITSAIEDTRPPYMKEQQAMEADKPDPEGQRRVAQAISKVLKQPIKRYKTMPKSNETVTVRNMKEAIQKAQAKGSQAQPPEVVQQDSKQAQPALVDNSVQIQPEGVYGTTSEGCIKQRNKTTCEEVNLNKLDIQLVNCGLEVLHNQHVDELIAGGLTIACIQDALDTLLPLYQAEGIAPTSAVLMAGIRQLQADAR